MSAVPEVNPGEFGERSRIHAFHLVVLFILSALPAAAAAAFGPAALVDANPTLLTLYVATLPWSLALCAITAGFVGGWFGPDERKQVLAVAGLLLVSAVIGRALAPGAAVEGHFSGGSPLVVVSEAIVFSLIGYALVYGWPMWCASFLVAANVGWLVREKSQPEDIVEVESVPALTTRVVHRSPSVPARAALPARSAILPPHPAAESPSMPRSDDFASLTKAELYKRSRELGIKGRSAMSKAELLAALRGNR